MYIKSSLTATLNTVFIIVKILLIVLFESPSIFFFCLINLDITDDVTCTLRAQSQHPPCVIDEPKAAGFCTEHSAKARGIGYEEEKSPTLRAGVVPAALSALSIENHPADSRVKIAEDGKVQTLCNRIATGGGSVPMVAEPVPEIKAFGI